MQSFCDYNQDNWSTWLLIAKFFPNNHSNTATRQSAFETEYGLNPPWDTAEVEASAQEANRFSKHMEKVWDKVMAAMELHRTRGTNLTERYKVGH